MSDATPSDLDLLSRARRGDTSAAAELYTRHAGAARRLAATFPRAGDPDDLVNEAFERVLGALGRGSGPDEAFRAYLFVTLRRVAAEHAARHRDEPIAEVPEPVEARAAAHGPTFDPADRQIVLSAYQSLPDRQQAVLWHTAVEGRPPRDLAPILGVSANAVSAMASRARERLREAYLQAHLQVPPPPECAPHRRRLGAYVRNSLAARDRAATEAHVTDCRSCRDLVLELADVNQLLVQALHPVFLATAATGTLAAGVAGRAVATGRRALSKARSNPVAVGAVVAAAALVAALVAVRIGDTGPPELAAPVDEPLAPADAPDRDVPVPAPRSERAAATSAGTPAPAGPRARPAEPTQPRTPAPGSAPATTRPGSAAGPSRPAGPTAPSSTVDPADPAEPVDPAVPPTTAPPAPPPTSPPPPPPPTTRPPPSEPTMGPVVWLPDRNQLQITLANPGHEPTSHLALGVGLQGGAVVAGWPTGCQLAVPLVWSAGCAVRPLAPGGEAVVRVPVTVTGPGQTARVSLCAVRLLTVDCNTGILRTTTVALAR